MVAGRLSEHFERWEFACRCGCGFDFVDAELVRVLEALRAHFGGRRVDVSSGCRCPAHNAVVTDSASGSRHLYGTAADFRVVGVDAAAVADYLESIYPDRYGIGRYSGRTHLDVRKGVGRWVVT